MSDTQTLRTHEAFCREFVLIPLEWERIAQVPRNDRVAAFVKPQANDDLASVLGVAAVDAIDVLLIVLV